MGKPIIFVSYSHKDERWKDRLETHLRVLGYAGRLDIWSDRSIAAGDKWRPAIRSAIQAASAAVMLVSADFLTSRFIQDEEIPALLRRRSEEGLRIVPVIVKACAWDRIDWLSAIQARPLDGKPIAQQHGGKRDALLTVIAKEIDDLVGADRTSELGANTAGLRQEPEGPKPTTIGQQGSEGTAQAITPLILSLDLDTIELRNGGSVAVRLTAKSDAPVNWVNRTLVGPAGTVYGGGAGVKFVEQEPGTWLTTWIDAISPWAPSGTYTYRDVSVRNEGQLVSEAWPPMQFAVVNESTADAPILEAVELSRNMVPAGQEVMVSIRATSKAPVSWLNRSLTGPRGNIYGGGSGVRFEKVGSQAWGFSWKERISRWAPVGSYVLSKISVMNEGRLLSNVWPDVAFEVVPPETAHEP